MTPELSDDKVILEAFKPGTAPPDSYSVIGLSDESGTPYGQQGVTPETQRQIGRGPHGLW